ncbi:MULTISPECIES: hypothetical protein [unclassified Mesorhizobium]|uniref:MmyB family transcriptional regulator n=1 Tax=unclassified Mesorhizobium TaxID=325217 RepID=UPI0013E2D1EC|nr:MULTISPECIES: hypothetical protein [unclassified Mesorhizobium]
MVARLSEFLDIPLRDRNSLFFAAGFAPAFRESTLDGLSAAKAAMDRVLQAHKPYPAFAVDRHWTVVMSNAALPQLNEGCSADLMQTPVNAMRLILHPAGMSQRILTTRLGAPTVLACSAARLRPTLTGFSSLRWCSGPTRST